MIFDVKNEAVAKHQTLRYVKYLNYSYTAVYSVFKYLKSLDFGLLQQPQNVEVQRTVKKDW